MMLKVIESKDTSFYDKICKFYHEEITYRVDILARVLFLGIGAIFISAKGMLTFSISILSINYAKCLTDQFSIDAGKKDFEVAYAFIFLGGKAFLEGFRDPIFFQRNNDVSLWSFTKGIVHWIVLRPYWDIDIPLLY